MKKSNIFLSIFLCLVIANIILSPQKFVSSAMNGISAWTFNVFPSVLPFMIITKMLSELGVIEKFCKVFEKPMKKFYRTSPLSAYTFFMSVLSGYPVGSKMIADLYESGKITREDACKMSSFCSNSGPMFIVGSVGTSMFLSPKAGYIILIAHILSAIFNGLLYRNIKLSKDFSTPSTQEKKEFNLGDIILSSTEAILSVGAIIAFFFIIIECLSPILNLFPENVRFTLEGMIEITRGCLDLSSLASLKSKIVLASFIITFGGFSTILQSIALLKRVKMPIALFTLQKLTQGLISIGISAVLCEILL